MSQRDHQEEQRPLPEGGEPVRVLIVDDQEAICRVLRRALEREGYAVEVAFSVQSARERLAEEFDVVVLDLDLPDGSGFELVELAREAGGAPTSVIMMTGNPSQESLGQSLRQGVHEMLFKPFRQAELREAVARAVESHERWRQRLHALRFAQHEPLRESSVQRSSAPARPSERELGNLPIEDRDAHSTNLIADNDLTEREREILQLILQGLQNSEIAERLDISGNTVKYHVRNLLTKLGMESRTELFRMLLRHSE